MIKQQPTPLFKIPEFENTQPRITADTIVFSQMPETKDSAFANVLFQKFATDTTYSPKHGNFIAAKPEFEALSDEQKKQYRLITGQNNFGIHNILQQSCTYISVVQDPITQFITNYFSTQKKLKDGNCCGLDHPIKNHPTLESWVTYQLKITNESTKAGYLVENLVQQDKIWLPEGAYINPDQIPENEYISKVLANIKQYFSFIAISELMDESLFLFAKFMGWDSIPVWADIQKVTPFPSKKEIHPATLESITFLNASSVLIYESFVKILQDSFNKLFANHPRLAPIIQEYRKLRADTLGISVKEISSAHQIKKPKQHRWLNSPHVKEQEFVIPEFANIIPISDAQTHIFCHLPSSGGNSVFDFVLRHTVNKNNYCPPTGSFEDKQSDVFSFSDDKKRSFLFYHGHENFGLHTILPQKCSYFTFLRDPVSTLVSQYYYAWNIAVTKGIMFEHYTNHKNINDFADYLLSQRTSIMGPGYIVHYLNQFAPPWLEDGKYITTDKIDPIAAEQRTRKNIEKYFLMIGITERFSESMFLLARKLGWKSIPYWTHKSGTTNRPKLEDHPRLVLKKMEMIVGHSITIYNECLKKFDEEYNAMLNDFPGLEASVKRYKQEREKK